MKTLKIMMIILSIGLLFTIVGCTTNKDEVVSVTGITIQSAGALTSITTHAGTLQLSATVTPADATDKRLTWSVTDGTGSAIINQNGLLSAVMNGTVTVKAVSQSAKAISAELVITISNQVTDNTAPLATAIAEANQNMNQTRVGTSSDQFVPSITWVLSADQTTYQQAITLAQATLSETPLIMSRDLSIGTPAEIRVPNILLNLARDIFFMISMSKSIISFQNKVDCI